MDNRAILFIDGNNWFHGLKHVGVERRLKLDYGRISRKLTHPRKWCGTRYYIGRMLQDFNKEDYRSQRSFLSRIVKDDKEKKRISYHLGRIEKRKAENEAAKALLQYLSTLTQRIDQRVYKRLVEIGQRYKQSTFLVEKAVDVNLAIDLSSMAENDEYDTAYLLSADGDFTPAVKAARRKGKKVFAVSTLRGAQLAQECDSFITLDRNWFADCYR